MNIIEQFYTAFSKLDGETMASFYHDDIEFKDPAFGVLKGEKAKNMWRMLCESADKSDFKVNHSNATIDGNVARAKWEAFYSFSATKRKVHNIVSSEFELKDGKIIKHTDRFDSYRWAKQALGFSGYLIGWTPFFEGQLKKQTNKLLNQYESKKNSE